MHASPGTSPPSNRKAILVVEDEALLREIIVSELDDAGFDVLEAASATEALDVLERQHVCLLFTDIRMPGVMDGWDLAEEARRRRPEIKVIYTSGYSAEAPRLVPNSLYLGKPYRPSEVLKAIGKLSG